MTDRWRTPCRIAALLTLVACGPDVPDILNATTYERYSCTPVAGGFSRYETLAWRKRIKLTPIRTLCTSASTQRKTLVYW